MTAKTQDIRVFPGDTSNKFHLLERTIDTGGLVGFAEDPPYILNATGNSANGVDVTQWHSVTVTHVAQDYSQDGWTGCTMTLIPWRYYRPIAPRAAAAPPVVNIPPRGAWIADDEVTVSIDAVTTGTTQQKVYPTLNADKMFFQVTSVLSPGEEEGSSAAGAQYLRQSIFGVTPRSDDGHYPSVVGTAGGGGAGAATTSGLTEPVDVNTIQLAGNPIDLGAGNVGAGTQRVTVATDDVNLAAINAATAAAEALLTTIDVDTSDIVFNTGAALISLAIMDDWDAVHDAVAGTDGVRTMGYASDSQVAAVSANGDDVRRAFSRHGESYDAAHTYPTQSNRSEEIDPANQWYEFSTLVSVTNGADGTYSYYIPMASYMRLDMQAVLSGGSGTITLTVEASVQNDGTAPASLSYIDVTNLAYGVAGFNASAMLIDNQQFFGAFSYVKVKIVANTGGSDNADWTVYIKKTWE